MVISNYDYEIYICLGSFCVEADVNGCTLKRADLPFGGGGELCYNKHI